MRTFRLMIVGALLTGLFAVAALGQAATSTKIAVIDTGAFAATGGIVKYINAQKRLETEFKPATQQLQGIVTRINTLKTELANLQKTAKQKVPVAQKTITDKVTQHDALTRELKFKQEETKVKFDNRRAALLGPVSKDISKALEAYSKQKGYALILDIGQLQRTGIILAVDKKSDVTKDFIIYYNSRPAGTASATK